jgi:hypothetical protein
MAEVLSGVVECVQGMQTRKMLGGVCKGNATQKMFGGVEVCVKRTQTSGGQKC